MKIFNFDLETTSSDANTARIVQIAYHVLDISEGDYPIISHPFVSLVNPGVPIEPEATAVHGITNEMVAEAPKFSELVAELLHHVFSCEMWGGFNIVNFDLPILQRELDLTGSVYDVWHLPIFDALSLWRRKNPATLSDVYRNITGQQPDPDKTHDAMYDTEITAEIIADMCVTYDLELNPAKIHDLIFPPDPLAIDRKGVFRFNLSGEPIITLGKHKGRTILDILQHDRGYLEWIVYVSDFDMHTKLTAKAFLLGRMPPVPDIAKPNNAASQPSAGPSDT